MTPRIVFLVMSAVHDAHAVNQLACALKPHVVLVHHDFSQSPEFALTAENVVFVPNPVKTGWADFGFVDGIFHSLRYALDHLEFDYLQLLSPTCLPIKPLREFESHVSGANDANFAYVDLLGDIDALMSVGYRAFAPVDSFKFRFLRKISRAYFGESTGRRDEAGIWLRSGFSKNAGGGKSLVARFAQATIRVFSRRALAGHVFDEHFRPLYGTTWFGARRHLIAKMVEVFHRPGIRDYFCRLHIADEFLIPSLLVHVGAKGGPMNHYIKKFNEARPGWFDDGDFQDLRASACFFARKFPDDASLPIRKRVLAELVGSECSDERRVGDERVEVPT